MAYEIPIPLVAALSGAAAGGASAWMLEWWRRRRDSRTLLNALFAELQHLREHYGYAAAELPSGNALADIPVLRRALLWSKFDAVNTARDFQKFGFLDAPHVQLLLQIAFRVRNTDTYIGLLLERPERIDSRQLEELRTRMKAIAAAAEELTGYLSRVSPALRPYAA